MARRTVLGTTATLLAVVALAGCSSGGDAGAGDDAAAQAPAEAPDDAAPEGEDDGDPAAEPQGEGGLLTAVTTVVDERAIVYTVELSISTDDVQAAADQAIAIATAAGGFVASERMRSEDDATLTLRVPSAGHHAAVTELEALGEVTDRGRGAEDVTQEVVDTASRIESQRASIARIRALLAEATELGDVVSIESELARREADLDALLTRQQELAGLTSLATITLSLYATGEEPPEDPEDEGGFLWGLSNGWNALLTVGGGLLTVLGALLPFAALAALTGVPAYRYWRRRRGQAQPAPVSAPPAPPASTPPAPAPPAA